MKQLKNVVGIKNPYSRRILTNVIGKDVLRVLAQTPQNLGRVTKGLTSAQLRRSIAKGKWSITQIMAHLCDAEVVLAFRLRMVLSDSGTRIQAYDQEKWARHLKYEKANFAKQLRLYASLRQHHISLFRSLTPAEWRRYGMHEERGKETLERLVQMYAGHDLNHYKQIKQLATSLSKKSS